MSQTLSLMISSPASNSGKTCVTAGLANYFNQKGKHVQVYKIGPDYLDPMVLEVASGRPVQQLDLWMQGQQYCHDIFSHYAQDADIVLVEGSMGLFDGQPSCADLAKQLQLPIALVVNAEGMAESVAAIAHGFKYFEPNIQIKGIVANRVASEKHKKMIQRGFKESGLYLGSIRRNNIAKIPSRHLGLVQAQELDLKQQIDYWTQQVAETLLINSLDTFEYKGSNSTRIETKLKGIRIAISRDEAFSFLYPHNIEILESMGAELHFFSPLKESLPDCDALYLTGGYPENHLHKLRNNKELQRQIQQHHAENKPLVAECGGFLYLLKEFNSIPLCNIIPFQGEMQDSLVNLGYQTYSEEANSIRGHTFHHSQVLNFLTPYGTEPKETNGKPEFVFRNGRLRASYVHWQFCSNPNLVASWFHPQM